MNMAIILAAGQGTRMKSRKPKVLHSVCGKPMLKHVIDTVKKAGLDSCVVVVGHGGDEVKEAISEPGTVFVTQEQQLGTGHAVMMAESLLPPEGTVAVLCGDTPLIREETLRAFFRFHEQNANCVSVMSAVVDQPYGYGRMIKSADGNLTGIVEEKDASEEEKAIREINGGIYCFEAGALSGYLSRLTAQNAQGEYYLTDIIGMAAAEGKKMGSFTVKEQEEIMGVNNRVQLARAEAVMRKRIGEEWMLRGVTLIDPANVYIEADVEIGMDTVIYPGVILTGKTRIGEGCLVGHNSRIQDSRIDDFVTIQSSTIIESTVGEKTSVGPYAYLRPGSRLGKEVKIGDFVEVKNASIGDGSKASHLSYVGDADVGEYVNIGCGVVFVNYDGIRKFRTTVEDHAFIGSNSNLVAPVVVESYGYVAAGTTVTMRVPGGALAVGRAKERLIAGWGERKMKKKENES